MIFLYRTNRALAAVAVAAVALLSLAACGTSSADHAKACEVALNAYVDNVIVDGADSAIAGVKANKDCSAMKPADFDALKNRVMAARYGDMVQSIAIRAFAN